MKRFLIFAFVILSWGVTIGQAPDSLSFQAVIRSDDGSLLVEQLVGAKIIIHQGSADGQVVFSETHADTTNENGLLTLFIGGGNKDIGDLSAIDWSKGPYFIERGIDPEGGTNYQISGTSQILSVPYALHANVADTARNIPQLRVSKIGDTLFVSDNNYVIIPGASYGGRPVADFDGNRYDTVRIGTQVWLSENLRTTHYNDGTEIPNLSLENDWLNDTLGAFNYFDNDETYAETYGIMYNWFAVNTGKLCPSGWHVPTETELNTLNTFLGGTSVTGGKLKETGTSHWNSPNEGATNDSGFTALPGGIRGSLSPANFSQLGEFGYFWSSTPDFGNNATFGSLSYQLSNFSVIANDKNAGVSVRCIKD